MGNILHCLISDQWSIRWNSASYKPVEVLMHQPSQYNLKDWSWLQYAGLTIMCEMLVNLTTWKIEKYLAAILHFPTKNFVWHLVMNLTNQTFFTWYVLRANVYAVNMNSYILHQLNKSLEPTWNTGSH